MHVVIPTTISAIVYIKDADISFCTVLTLVPRSMAPSSAPRSVATRYRPRQPHLGCHVVHDQTPRSQDLWRRDVLFRSHEFWRRPSGSKDEFMLFKGLNINFFKKKGPNVKKKLGSSVVEVCSLLWATFGLCEPGLY